MRQLLPLYFFTADAFFIHSSEYLTKTRNITNTFEQAAPIMKEMEGCGAFGPAKKAQFDN